MSHISHNTCFTLPYLLATYTPSSALSRLSIDARLLRTRLMETMVSFYIALYDALPKETRLKRAFFENPLDFTLSEATTGRRPSLHEIKTFISFFRRKSTTIFSFSVLSLSLSVFSTPDGFLPSRRTIGRYIGLFSPHLSPCSSSMLPSRISATSQ